MEPSTEKKKKKITSRQVVAMAGVVLLVLLYLVTLIVAIVDKSLSGHLFLMCLIATMAIPILIWVYTWLYGRLTGKHTFADFDLGQTGTAAEGQKDSPGQEP
ncbi:MAG: hypothetical protein NC081_09840 [Roseburia sp.]|nr:hypothetical protein [Roseburia sp.]